MKNLISCSVFVSFGVLIAVENRVDDSPKNFSYFPAISPMISKSNKGLNLFLPAFSAQILSH